MSKTTAVDKALGPVPGRYMAHKTIEIVEGVPEFDKEHFIVFRSEETVFIFMVKHIDHGEFMIITTNQENKWIPIGIWYWYHPLVISR